MHDRIKVLKMGKEKQELEYKAIKKELDEEYRKTDVYLDKDRERLTYAKEVCHARWLVMRSFE